MLIYLQPMLTNNAFLLSFIGAQNGIYQLRVDIHARQYYNSITLR
jgi:hypothetical protein